MPRGRLAYRGSIDPDSRTRQPSRSISTLPLTTKWCQCKFDYKGHEIVFIGAQRAAPIKAAASQDWRAAVPRSKAS